MFQYLPSLIVIRIYPTFLRVLAPIGRNQKDQRPESEDCQSPQHNCRPAGVSGKTGQLAATDWKHTAQWQSLRLGKYEAVGPDKKLRTIYHTLACGSTSAINSSAVVQSILHDEGKYHNT